MGIESEWLGRSRFRAAMRDIDPSRLLSQIHEEDLRLADMIEWEVQSGPLVTERQ